MTYAASVIIPTYNGAHLLVPCLDALREQTFTGFETIVVDNASTDETPALLATRYPDVKVIRLPTNTFFSGAVNAGIRASSSPLVVLLNNDTEPEPTWLAELLGTLAAHPEAGSAASKILLWDKRDHVHSAGDFFGRDGVPGNRGVWGPDRGWEQPEYVFGACGGAAAYRRSMLERIGLFDEDFVGYCEDVDLAFRAQLAGYRCVFSPRARVYHRLSATGGGPRASYLCGRNFLYVITKNVPGKLLWRYGWRMLNAQLRYTLRSIRHLREPAARAWLRGQLAALRGIPVMLKKRTAVQRSRRVPLSYIDAILS